MKSFELVSDLNEILSRYGVSTKLGIQDFTVTEETINDLVKEDKIMSDAITESIWDKVSEKEVFHYTKKIKAESILNSGGFRLYNLTKRFAEGEVNTFCVDHNLLGYLDRDPVNNCPIYKSLLMDNMYYASFSDIQLNDMEANYLKEEFSSYQGVRFKLKITATNNYFKKVVYNK
ncbi:hypothetical protein L4C41_20985, partial [Aliivibrio salmonicida]